ncbi:MAG: hypothetical protein HY077_12890 [Elusimicrobia bacterium]|nr:hypothetical protein [Elusimicrobiota bacterium]
MSERLEWVMRKGIATALLLALVWLVPPFIHRTRRLCPVRPDGVSQAIGLPAFARKYGVSCSQCHYAFPVLNAYGRQFKMNGYVRERGSEESVLQSNDKELWTEKIFPWALIARSRPYDLGRGNVSNAGANFGHGTDANGLPLQGFQFQPITDIDMFIVGGDASKHVSFFGEFDAPASGGFGPGGGDFSLGYHPKSYANVIIGRRGFWGMDPYQTIADNESPTLANRALGAGMPDQGGLSGNTLGEMTQTAMVYGQLTKENLGSLYYAAGATSGNADDLGVSAKNANFRVALDNNKGLMFGGFTSFGHETPASIPAAGGVANVPNNNFPAPTNPNGAGKNAPWNVRFMKAGIDAVAEYNNFAARGAAMYSYDHVTYYDNINDPLTLNALRLKQMKDWAAYAEIMYSYKRGGNDYPFLLPLIRDNWYTTYNGKRSFHFITAHLAHYFRPNVKAFVEYSMDIKTDIQGPPAAIPDLASRRVPRGDRGSFQIEVGF